jgi:hypothetical protein
VTKRDLAYYYQQATGNTFLHRLAEHLSTNISQYAEKNNIDGDLATRLNNYVLTKKESPLTPKERAWASSFNQKNPELANVSERMLGIMAQDFKERFDKINKNKTNNKKGKSLQQSNPSKRQINYQRSNTNLQQKNNTPQQTDRTSIE